MFSTIKLEDYFEFQSAEDIRIVGHRIGIEDVLKYYLEGYTPEEININLPSLSLEKIYATITYYLHNKQQIDAYLEQIKRNRENSYKEFIAHPPSIVQKLKAEKVRRNGTSSQS